MIVTNSRIKTILFILNMFFASTTVFSQQLSDSEIKKNVTPVISPLQKLLQLEPKMYEFETSKYNYLKLPQGKKYGFISENVQAVFPELVSIKTTSYMFAKNGYRDASIKLVDEASLIPLLVAAIKEQQAQIEKLKAAVETLNNSKPVTVN